jgi:chromosome segregation ATPase
MGWISFREDLIRIRSDLASLEKNASTSDGMDVVEHHRAISQLLFACKQLLQQLDDNLELATDPETNAAAELATLQKTSPDLERKVTKYEEEGKVLKAQFESKSRDHANLDVRFMKLNSQNGKLASKNEALEKEVAKLRKELGASRRGR